MSFCCLQLSPGWYLYQSLNHQLGKLEILCKCPWPTEVHWSLPMMSPPMAPLPPKARPSFHLPISAVLCLMVPLASGIFLTTNLLPIRIQDLAASSIRVFGRGRREENRGEESLPDILSGEGSEELAPQSTGVPQCHCDNSVCLRWHFSLFSKFTSMKSINYP